MDLSSIATKGADEQAAAAALAQRSAAFLALVEDWASWAEVRTEQVDLLGFGETRVTSTLTFTLDRKRDQLTDSSAIQIPVAYLTSTEIRDMEVRDEAGRRLPILTVAQSNQLSMNALSLAGGKIAAGSQSDVDEVLKELFTSGSAKVERFESLKSKPVYAKLWNDRRFSAMANELLSGRYVVVELRERTFAKQVLELTYRLSLPKDPVAEVRTTSGEWWEFLEQARNGLARALRPLFINHLTLSLPTVALASYYEVVINAPNGLVFSYANVSTALLTGGPDHKNGKHGRQSDAGGGLHGDGEGPGNGNQPQQTDAVGGEESAVVVSGRQIRFATSKAQRKVVAIVSAGFVPDPGGILRSALYMSALTSIALVSTLLLRLFDVLKPTTDASAAVLLAIPGILVAYVVTVQVHPFTGHVSRIVSGLIYATAGISIVAAAVLTLTFPPSPIVSIGSFVLNAKRLTWAILAMVSVLVTVLLWTSLVVAKLQVDRPTESTTVRIIQRRLRQGTMQEWRPPSNSPNV